MYCISGEKKHATPQEDFAREAKVVSRGKLRSEPLFREKDKAGQSKSLRLASLNNFGRLWAVGMVSGCLVPGPGMI